MRKEFEINGCIEVSSEVTEDEFWKSATRSLAVKSQRTNNKIPLFG